MENRLLVSDNKKIEEIRGNCFPNLSMYKLHNSPPSFSFSKKDGGVDNTKRYSANGRLDFPDLVNAVKFSLDDHTARRKANTGIR